MNCKDLGIILFLPFIMDKFIQDLKSDWTNNLANWQAGASACEDIFGWLGSCNIRVAEF